MELTDFFVILLILILIGLIFYFGFVSTSPIIITQSQKQVHEQKREYELDLPYPTNHSMYPNDMNMNMNVNNNPSYQNEVIVQDEYLKEGDYTKQFKEIDMNNIPKPNTNIGFNPEAKEDSKQLPFADVHINYLLNN